MTWFPREEGWDFVAPRTARLFWSFEAFLGFGVVCMSMYATLMSEMIICLSEHLSHFLDRQNSRRLGLDTTVALSSAPYPYHVHSHPLKSRASVRSHSLHWK
jgi:hypothetical protein